MRFTLAVVVDVYPGGSWMLPDLGLGAGGALRSMTH